jgi:hypothetical protein
MRKPNTPPGTWKVRRDLAGGKRGQGAGLQKDGRRVRRFNPDRITLRPSANRLTGVAGLVEFGRFLKDAGVDRQLDGLFGHLKAHPATVYPMAPQLRLLIDANVAGEPRVFGLEGLAADPLFELLAGGSVPSIDVVYDDLTRFGPIELMFLERLVAHWGLVRLAAQRRDEVHIDIDTTVEPLFGQQEGALPGPNPRYHGRPSYHPILAYCPEVDAIVGAQLRPGDTGFGQDDIPVIKSWVERVREVVGPDCAIRVRIDAAGHNEAVLAALHQAGVHFVVKARMTRDVIVAIAQHRQWETVERDATGHVSLAGANIMRQDFADGTAWRLVAVRSTERFSGRQLPLWDTDDLTVQAYVTNDDVNPPDLIQRQYDGRADVEPTIGELKSGWGIGKVPTKHFAANHAAFLVKLLAFNLLKAFLIEHYARLSRWRVAWVRRVLVCRPGRLCRAAGRTWVLRTAPTPKALAPPAS